MNKPEQVKNLAQRLETTQVDAAFILDEVFNMVVECFENGEDSIRLGTLGTLKVVERAERRYQNIQTKETAIAPAHYTVTFTPSPSLKAMVNSEAEEEISEAA